jgi:hypothetical protein
LAARSAKKLLASGLKKRGVCLVGWPWGAGRVVLCRPPGRMRLAVTRVRRDATLIVALANALMHAVGDVTRTRMDTVVD